MRARGPVGDKRAAGGDLWDRRRTTRSFSLPSRHFFFAAFDFDALLFVFFAFGSAVFLAALAGASAGVGGVGGRA